jgi:hypothetical protein
MNPISRVSTLVLCTLFAGATAVAQNEKEPATNDKRETLAERIGSIVGDVVTTIQKELAGQKEEANSKFEVRQMPRSQQPGDDEDLSAFNDTSVTYEGATVIHRRDTINSNVVVKGGDLTVFGTITGDVLVVGGDVYLREGAYVGGNVKVINGEVVKDDDAVVVGFIDKSSSKKEKPYREQEKNFRRSSTRLNASWVSETTNLDNFIFRYNRVEGLFLGVGSNKRYYWDGQRSYGLYGSVGYGFKSHAWRGNLGLSRQFAFDDGQLFEVEAEAHSLTDTKDEWLIGVHENTGAAILFHEDYRDYFRRDGYGVNAGYAMQQDYLTAQVKVGYLADEYRSMENKTEWAIFGGKKRFRPNPMVDEDKIDGVVASAGLSTLSTTIDGPEGWSIYATAEFMKWRTSGEPTFERYVLDVRRYQPLGRWDNLNVRIRAGSSNGILPIQKTFDMGGRGTIEAYPFKEDQGNRMLLANAEFIVNGDFLGDLAFWPSWLMRGINLIFLADAGLVRDVAPTEIWTRGFENIRFSDFKHDVGVGVSSRNGSFRMAFVWRTDQAEPPKFVIRFSRPF